MTSDASIVIGIKGQLEGGRRVKRTLDDVAKSGERAQTSQHRLERQMTITERAASTLGRTVSRLVIAYGGVVSIKALLRVSDVYTNIQNRLKLVTDSTEELNSVQADLVRISDNTFTSLSSNATLFNRLTISTRELGVSTNDVLRATEALQQTFRISGSTASEAANSTIQFAQGLAAGALRGDEFNSVMEQNTRLQLLLAEGLGVSAGALRGLAADGKLSAEEIFPILVDSLEKLNAEAEDISPTFEQAFNKISEKFGQGIDEAIRANSNFSDLGETVSGFKDDAFAFGQGIGLIISGLSNVTEEVNKAREAFSRFFGIAAPVENFSRVPEDFGLGPPFTEISQNDFNVALGGINNVAIPSSKPDIPDSFFLRQAEEREKAIQKQIQVDRRSKETIDSVTEGLEFQIEQIGRNKLEQQVYNNVKRAGVALDSQAGEKIAKLTEEYVKNTEQLEKQSRIVDGLTGAFDGFFKSAIQGADGFKGALRGLAGSLADLIFQLNVIEPLKRNLSGASLFGGGSGGFLSGIGSAIGGLFGFNSGGSMVLGGAGGYDQNILSLNGSPIARTTRGETLSISPTDKSTGRGVTINQVINLSMGVDTAVAVEVQRVLPQIKEATRASVKDAELRGIA